jgi:uncharacterized protein (DUF885 family)
MSLDDLVIKYMDQMKIYWKEILKSKYNKYFYDLLSITHLTGIHIDFFHKPYLFLNKKYPELIFRNIIFKKIIKLNKLLYKEIYLPIETVTIMIQQCKIAVENKDYWIRSGYNNFQINIIEETYKVFENYLTDYIKYLNNRTKTEISNVVGLGKTEDGENLYEFILKYHTGFQNITPEFVQEFGLLRLQSSIKKIEEYTKLPFTQARNNYMKQMKYFTSLKDFMSATKENIIKLREISTTLFDNTIDIPYAEKISIKPIPKMRAMWGSNAKAQHTTLFINNLHWNRISQDLLLKLCAHEAIPGHILERYNTNKIFDNYFVKKKLKKYMTKGVTACKEGWAIYSETLIGDLFGADKTLHMLFHDVFQAVRIIVDVGLNSNKAKLKFNILSAKEFMKTYMLSSDTDIDNQLYKYLAKPAQVVAYGFGYYCIKEMFNKTGYTNIKFNSLFMKMPLNLSLLDKFMKEDIVKNI